LAQHRQSSGWATTSILRGPTLAQHWPNKYFRDIGPTKHLGGWLNIETVVVGPPPYFKEGQHWPNVGPTNVIWTLAQLSIPLVGPT